MMTDLQRQLLQVDGIYHIPDDDLIGRVLIPAVGAAKDVRVGAGFFSSGSLAQLAPGLATYLNDDTAAPIRMILSPSLSVEDSEAIHAGVEDKERVVSRAMTTLFDDAKLSASKLVKHTLDCLAYLVASERLLLKVALYPNGSYHRKIWILTQGPDTVVVHGSGNATYRGLVANGEQMTVDCSWWDEPRSLGRIRRLQDVWESEWHGESPHCMTVPVPDVIDRIREYSRSIEVAPRTEDLWRAWQDDYALGLAQLRPTVLVDTSVTRRLRIPAELNWQEGRYGHQARAVKAFEDHGSQGILAIATGGGKTKTSLIAATRAQDQHDGPFCVVVLVPSSPLEAQWSRELQDFGVEPLRPSSIAATRRRARLQEMRAALSVSRPHTEALVLQTSLLRSDASVRQFFADISESCLTFLIGDEVHNLGAVETLNALPPSTARRLGLSATPVRQYDPDGTQALVEYFGGEVFRFDLGEAIETGCLVKYDFHLHEVHLTGDEFDAYTELTARIARLGRAREDGTTSGGGSELAKRLLRERRAVLEHAAEKLEVLKKLLVQLGPKNVSRTLIYASQKPDPLGRGRQIDAVNALLRSLAIDFHQFTYTETSRPGARRYLERFGRGELQVLTAMKVLDEGVDLPETNTAFLLASSTVEREWVQRRGRILRVAPNKTSATLHDFLVVPPAYAIADSAPLIKSELKRANAFAQLAENEYAHDGPRDLIRKYEEIVYSRSTYEDE